MEDKSIQLKCSLFSDEKSGIYIEHQLSILALVMYIISLYIFVDNPQLINISRILFLIFAVFTSIRIAYRKKIYVEKPLLYVCGFYMFCLASYFWGINQNDVVKNVILLAQMLILMFFVSQLLNSRNQIEVVVFGIAIAGVILFIYGVMIYGFENIYYAILSGERLGKEISQENVMGRLATFSVIVFFTYGVEKKIYRYFVFAFMPFMMVLASGSRTAVAILIVGIAITIFSKVGIKKSYKLILLIPTVVVVFYFLLQLSMFDAIKLRYLSLYSTVVIGDGTDGAMRMNMAKWGLEWFVEKPIWGYGIGNYAELLANKVGLKTYAHNNYIELLVGVGIIGFLLYYAAYVYIFYHLFQGMRKKESISTILFVMLFTWMCAEIAAVNYTSKMTYVLLGICNVYIRLSKTEKRTKNISRKR